MPIDMVNSANYIKDKGGKRWSYVRVTAPSGSVSNGDTIHEGVMRSKTDFSYKRPFKKITDESGDTVATVLEDADVSIKITSLQSDSYLENFLVNETEDNYFQVFMGAGDESSTTQKVRFFGLCRISPEVNESAPGRNMDINIIPLTSTVSITPALMPSWLTANTSGSYTQAAGTYYTVCSVSGSNTL